MIVLGEKAGFNRGDLLRESPLVSEVPFDYKLRYHATVHRDGEKDFLVVIGAPEAVIPLCGEIRRGGNNHPISKKDEEELDAVVGNMSEEGLRVLAVAVRSGPPKDIKLGSIGGLSFVGFFGMKDALRSEVAAAMNQAKEAGIRVIMITGDYKITARTIAKEAGIYKAGDDVLTGGEIDELTDEALSLRLGRVSVFARVTPEHKLKIINAYKKRGEIIAMTGDGVNDAPSLVAADLGVAMGRTGTEVAKEASDIVLLDDNFGNIVSAIEEGRSIYKTIRKVILYLFSTSAGEVLTIAVALFLGYPLPLLAAQIIWLNFVTDGFLDVALAMDPKEKGLLSGEFKRSSKHLVDRLMAFRMVSMSLPMMIGTLALFSLYFHYDMTKAWTISLTTLAAFQWFNAWNCRSEKESIFTTNPFANKFLVGATIVVVSLQIFAVYNPFLQKILNTTPLEAYEWLLVVSVASSIIVVEEVRKFFSRKMRKVAL
jgi:Ca2+-transporting ATPase